MERKADVDRIVYSRTPHGVRGLKFGVTGTYSGAASRTPHGVRGLKFVQLAA